MPDDKLFLPPVIAKLNSNIGVRDAVRPKLPIRVMVVEDFLSFRKFVCSKLEETAELQVICEVSDGWRRFRRPRHSSRT